MIRIAIIVLLVLSLNGYILAVPVENMIVNPDFDRGTQEWQLEIHADFVKATLESDNKESLTDNRSARIDILDLKPGAESWRLQFKQIGHKVKQGKRYTWTFWAKADKKTRPAEMLVCMEVDPWAGLGGSKAIIITENWNEYKLTFTANQDFNNTRLSICLAQSNITVWIDHVRFYEGEYVPDDEVKIKLDEKPEPKKGDNLLINPDFDLGTAGWNLEVHTDYVKALMLEDKTDGIGDKKCVRIEINEIQKGAEVWRLQFKQFSINIKANKTYTWAFWAKAADFRPANIWVGMEVDPWNTLGPSEEIMLEPEWKEYHFTFTATQNFDNTRLSIQLAGSKDTVWVDHVRFYEGEYIEEKIKDIGKGKAVTPINKSISKWGNIKNR